MTHHLNDDRDFGALDACRGEEALAATLRARAAVPSEQEAQHAFRRLCTSRATRRAIRDHRLAGKR
ncbi:hypothetical protein ABID82_000640 [Methylobacterium sp. PvP062]|jgi:hypothetical protein|uniref:Uncharacterized protein n=1 Tax=Methylobacterium radiotolerans TaxID=31998 RepID=A0ABV2NI84_9HYPH|nr:MULTISPECIES: hypothetical protein [Methylobacterium]MCX7333950.1 hypothetical protein [Hyphomicrobiales bacterium]GAN50238.1 hypothetical protein ME121_4277 [Methylobacterium sp. ME121]KIU30532.1 hypothetical protein SR39_20845 [Methylobacterium radiotolerans]KZC03183.1 hypothetical protein AU375_00622 [Methylobacterium radiotolerans]MBN6820099.1 hypothetical protein [Methylobacterium organophilum]